MSSLLIIDGLNIVRPIYSMTPLEDGPERVEQALTNSLKAVAKIRKALAPTHVCWVFDDQAPTWRHTLYDKYKEKRDPIPQVLADALPDFITSINDFHGVAFQIRSWEADDVLHTVVKRAKATSLFDEITVATNDKDIYALTQLDGVIVYDWQNKSPRNAQWVKDKYGIAPEQLSDYLALMGDTSDGIPGVYGVGPKTATGWFQEFGDLDGIIANMDKLKNKVGETFRNSQETLAISRKLTCLREAPVPDVDWDLMRVY